MENLSSMICLVADKNDIESSEDEDDFQTLRTRRLVCAFVVCKPQKADFLASRPLIILYISINYGRYR